MPEPQVARFHPYVERKEMFEKRSQESKQKAFIQHHRHSREDEGFLMCDNCFNSLGSPKIFHRLRCGVDARGVGIVQVLCPKNETRLSRRPTYHRMPNLAPNSVVTGSNAFKRGSMAHKALINLFRMVSTGTRTPSTMLF